MPGDRSVDPDSLAEARTDPQAADELALRHRRFLEETFPAWGHRQASALAEQSAKGYLRRFVWRPKHGEGAGLVWLQPLPTSVRVHGVWVEPASSASVSSLLEAIEKGPLGAITAVTDVLPGLDRSQQVGFFAPRGYWHREKVLLRRTSGGSSMPSSGFAGLRPIAVEDLRALVGVYARAYSDRPGEFWTWSSPDPWTEAEADVMGHAAPAGSWSEEFLPDASFVSDDEGTVRGAVFVSQGRSGVPYVDDLIVDPPFQRRGIGRSLLARSIEALERKGARAVELAAILHGAPYRLYRSLGFEDVPPPAGTLDGHWMRGRAPWE